jgi:hypothetical protein
METNHRPAAEPEVIATRHTFDGVLVNLHSDGSLSTRQSFLRVRLPIETMWRFMADVCLYNYAELAAAVKGMRAGSSRPFSIRKDVLESERVYREIVTSAGVRVDVRIH